MCHFCTNLANLVSTLVYYLFLKNQMADKCKRWSNEETILMVEKVIEDAEGFKKHRGSLDKRKTYLC